MAHFNFNENISMNAISYTMDTVKLGKNATKVIADMWYFISEISTNVCASRLMFK